MSLIPLASLPRKKTEQLCRAAPCNPFYISLERYEYDSTIRAVVYEIEIGIQYKHDVITRKFYTRYSSLQKLDNDIRPHYKQVSHLKDFPPKRYFWNMDPDFLKQRAVDLQEYLASLTRISGILNSNAFLRFFKIK